MSIQAKRDVVHLVDSCTVEEAEELHGLLLEKPKASIDLSACAHIHAAVLQVLLLQPRVIKKPPEDVFLKEWVVPLIVLAREERAAGVDTA